MLPRKKPPQSPFTFLRTHLERFLRTQWKEKNPLTLALLPFSWLFAFFVITRRHLLKHQQTSHQTPVIVIGNITVGGNGKTTFLIWLAKRLARSGLSVGIISRGYQSTPPFTPFFIRPDTDAKLCGDEAKLIALQTNLPVVIGPQRTQNVWFLKQHASIDVILSDDGLQHYRLARAMEIVLIQGKKPFGNGYLLPAGPLREPKKRLQETDLVIGSHLAAIHGTDYNMHYRPCHWVHVATGKHYPLHPPPFNTHLVLAITALGNPQSFFDSLHDLQIPIAKRVALADHSSVSDRDLANTQYTATIMTEKDRVKLPTIRHQHIWSLAIEAGICEQDETLILAKIANTIPSLSLKASSASTQNRSHSAGTQLVSS